VVSAGASGTGAAHNLDGVEDEELADCGADGHDEDVVQDLRVLREVGEHSAELPRDDQPQRGEGRREEVGVHHHGDGADRVLLEDPGLPVGGERVADHVARDEGDAHKLGVLDWRVIFLKVLEEEDAARHLREPCSHTVSG
jgi:hypothetical protein